MINYFKKHINLWGYVLVVFSAISIALTFYFKWWSETEPLILSPLIFALISSFIFKFTKIKYLYGYILLATFLLISYFGIGPISAVFFIWVSACYIGRLFNRVFSKSTELEWINSAALGFAIIGLFGTISSHFKINTSQYYLFVIVSISLISAFIEHKDAIKSGKLVLSLPLPIKEDFSWIFGFLIGVVSFYLYICTVLPDLSHDALSVHLNIPQKIIENAIWKYDISEYIWSLLPLGAEMIFLPTFMLGGENGIRLLTTSFLLATAVQIYSFSRTSNMGKNLSIGFSLVFLTLPVSFYLIGSTFVEPCFTYLLVTAFVMILNGRCNWYVIAAISGYACTIRITGFLFAIFFLSLYLYQEYKTLKVKPFVKLWIIFLVFSSINYIYAYVVSGNPIFPLMNEIFKSDLYSQSPFYHPFYINKFGIFSIELISFMSMKYGEFSSNGTIGLIFSIIIPLSVLMILANFKKWRYEIVLTTGLLIIIFFIFYFQAYIRYVYPALILFLFIFIILSTDINHKYLSKFLIIIAIINIIKIPYASTYFPWNYALYFDSSKVSEYISINRPYAKVGSILRDFPEFKGKKVMLIGAAYDPIYYYYPSGTVAYSWHSPRAFDLINQNPDNLSKVLKELNIEILVCPEAQVKDDRFNFSNQCKVLSERLFSLNGVYVGKVSNE